MASNAPSTPKTRAISNASSDDGSLTSSGAICTPTANPTAATHSQNSFRPKNKIAIPMSTPTIVTEECIGKAAFDNYSVEAIVPNVLFCSISVLDARIEAIAVTVAVLSGLQGGLTWLNTLRTAHPTSRRRLSGWWDLNPRPPGPEPGA